MKSTILTLFVAMLAAAETPGVLAIRGAKIVPGNAPAIEKGTVLVRNGLIEAVGANVNVPPDAWVIEGATLTVYPGLIDGLSTWGMPGQSPAPTGGGRGGFAPPGAPTPITIATPSTPAQTPATSTPPARGPEDRPSNTSWVHAQDAVQPGDRSIAAARNAGYAMAVVFPTNGIFAGQGAAINLAGEKAGQMVVTGSLGLYLATSSRGFTSFPGSLMGVIAYIRQIYLDADHYAAAKQAYQANARGQRRPDYDRALEGVLEAPRIMLPATRRVEIQRMVSFAEELRRPAILYGGHEGYKSADVLKASRLPVLVSLRWPERQRDADPEQQESLRTLDLRENAPSTPAALAKQGVKFAFYSGGVEQPGDLRRAVKRAVDAGLSHEDAVRALSLSVAEIYGFADRAGSIEPGKIANLTVTDGDLFQDRTKVKYVIIDGVKYEPAQTPERAQQQESGR